ncbi:hypothetical protein HanIR_Chr01g0044561 [Helianthus annuus]|nr:hypothetical protein HanIR_Chr01g0044561 [Helianthus annuus]
MNVSFSVLSTCKLTKKTCGPTPPLPLLHTHNHHITTHLQLFCPVVFRSQPPLLEHHHEL